MIKMYKMRGIESERERERAEGTEGGRQLGEERGRESKNDKNV